MWSGGDPPTPHTRLAWYLARGMILVVVATVVVGGLPAVAAMWLHLERQVWERVEKGQIATQALYQSERERIQTVARLVAERPMLCALLERGDTGALPAYLGDLRDSTSVDAVYVLDANGRVTGQAVRMLPPPETLLAGREPPFADFLALDDPSGLTIVAAAYLEPSPGCDPGARLGERLAVRIMQCTPAESAVRRAACALECVLEALDVNFTVEQGDEQSSCTLDLCPLCEKAEQTGMKEVELAHHGLSALCRSLIRALDPDMGVRLPAKPTMEQIFSVSMPHEADAAAR